MCMGGIKKRAVVVDDAIVARPMIMLALSFDHRIIDGAIADQFMADIQKQLENWQGSVGGDRLPLLARRGGRDIKKNIAKLL